LSSHHCLCKISLESLSAKGSAKKIYLGSSYLFSIPI
jgi:hypothetical protein